jgi:uncharacterized membrane protein YqjE
MASSEHSGGLFGSVRRVADTCLSSVHNRVELFALELQEEKLRLVRLLLWTGAALFSIFLAITIITIAIVMAFPDHSLLVLIIFGVLYAAIAAGTCVKLRNEMKDAPPPLAETIAELKKDVECLRSKDLS